MTQSSQSAMQLTVNFASTGLETSLRQAIQDFLRPVELFKGCWSTSHLICSQCLNLCASNHIIIRKVFLYGAHPLSSRLPTHCETPNITFIIQPPASITFLVTKQTTLYTLLQEEITPHNCRFMQILPLFTKEVMSNDSK
jgi:hypothetical protein